MGGVPPALISPEHPPLAMLHRAVVVSPFFLGTVVAVWSGARVVALSLATGLVFAPPSPRLLRCFLCLRCTSTGGLGSLACCGGWRLRRRSTPFSLGFLGRLLLRDRRGVVPVFVSFVSGFRGGVCGGGRRGVSVQPQLLQVACVLSQPQKPPYGVDGAVFRGAVVTTRSFSKQGCGGDGGF